jgi:hypothetical protein
MELEKSELFQPLNAKQLLTKAQQEVSDAIKEWIETKPVSLDEPMGMKLSYFSHHSV